MNIMVKEGALPEQVDKVMVVLYWADGIGVAELYRQIAAWHQRYGERWTPAALLRRLAETGTPFREAKPGRPM